MRGIFQCHSRGDSSSLFLGRLLKFRERPARAEVERQEGSFSASNAFIADLNPFLKQHPGVIALQRKGEKLGLETAFELEKPNDVCASIAIVVAELLSDVAPVRLRKCEACIVHFLDTSKKGSRRWCSMNICGNKIKVAGYQQRKRAAEKKMRRRR